MTQAILVTVLGREIPVRSSAPEKKVREVEAFVNDRIDEVRNRITSNDPQLPLILVLLNLAESYLESQSMQANLAEMDTRLRSMIELLDKTLETPGLSREI